MRIESWKQVGVLFPVVSVVAMMQGDTPHLLLRDALILSKAWPYLGCLRADR